MTIKVAINGYGRIGRNILRALYEGGHGGEIKVVAINDLGDANTNVHLSRFDTAHGRFRGDVHVDGDSMVVNGDRIRVVAQRDPSKLPWGELGRISCWSARVCSPARPRRRRTSRQAQKRS